MAVLGSPSLTVRTVSMDLKQNTEFVLVHQLNTQSHGDLEWAPIMATVATQQLPDGVWLALFCASL